MSLQRETLKGIAQLLRGELISSEIENFNFVQTSLFSIINEYWEEIGEKKQYMNYTIVYKNGEYEESPFGNIISHCDTFAIINDIHDISKTIFEDYENENIERVYIDNYPFELEVFRKYEERIFSKYRKEYTAKETYDIYRKIAKRFFSRYIK